MENDAAAGRGSAVPVIRFGPFELHVRAGELRKHHLKIRLQEQPLQILLMLLEHPGEVVLREEIRTRLWPNDTIVEFDHSINAAIKRLRDSLGESAEEPRYVETLARRGYRFIGEIESAPEQPAEPVTELAPPDELTGDLRGKTLAQYRVLEKLGEGGTGVVYRALDTKLNRSVAIKFLSEDLADSAARRRFQREAQMASSLNHPHILTVYDTGEIDGKQYLVTEYVDRGTLKDWAEGEKRAWPQILELLIGVADGLAAAHEAGILHRDIKPSNILVAKNGYAKLADFGLAKLAEGRLGDTTRTLTEQLSCPGLIVGTISYMSPEQASGQPLDVRSNIFSFGVVLYEVLAGRRPFTGKTDLEVLQSIIHSAPEPLGEETPLALRTVVERALDKNPASRYPSMRDMVADLKRLMRQRVEAVEPRRLAKLWIGAGAVLLAAVAYVLLRRQPSSPPRLEYTQLTSFTDSATRPALSPDGRLLAFYRSERTFAIADQIYVKLLPNGEPVQLTHDPRLKYNLAFSPDGSRIAYTVEENGYQTLTVPSLGGDSKLFVPNAAGLTWMDEHRLLFSELKTGVHLGIVTATENRSEHHEIYFPAHERAMAHYSYASPDHKWVLVVEMDSLGRWQSCRVVPLDGSSAGRQVGPQGACTSAAWSPDGVWMYFGAEVAGRRHLWRQRFPDGQPVQITTGTTEEDGMAMAPDGRSLITSISTQQSAVWIHDSHGDHAVSTEGYAAYRDDGWPPSFSSDGKHLYYLLRRDSPESATELWRADLGSGKSEVVLPGISIREYEVSSDEKEVVFSTRPAGQASQLWLAPLDRSAPPRRIASSGEASPHFGPDGTVLFQLTDGKANYLAQMRTDGSGRTKIVPYPIFYILSVSPDRRFVILMGPAPDSKVPNAIATMAVPLGGGPARRVCALCPATWSPDGKFFFVGIAPASRTNPTGKMVAIPVPPGETLPKLPVSGIPLEAAGLALPGIKIIEGDIAPGLNPSIYAYVKSSVHSNLFRLPLQ